MSVDFSSTKLSPGDLLSSSIAAIANIQEEEVTQAAVAAESSVNNVTTQPSVEVAQTIANVAPVETTKPVTTPPARGGSIFNRSSAPAQTGKADTKPQEKVIEPVVEQKMPEVSEATLPATAAANSKPTLRNAASRGNEKAISGYDAKILLASLKAFSPLVSAATYRPGNEAKPIQTSDAMKRMFEESEKVMKVICKAANVDYLDPDSQWIVSNARQIAATHVSNQWRRCKDPVNFSCNTYEEAINSIASLVAIEPEKADFPFMTDTLRVYLSVTKSLVPVMHEYQLYENVMAGMVKNYRIDRTQIFTRAAELIQEKAELICDYLGIPKTEEMRLVAYQAMLNHCGENMAMSVAYACDRMLDKFDAMSPAERQKHFEDGIASGNPLMLDLKALEFDFNESVNALAEIAKNSPKIYGKKATP